MLKLRERFNEFGGYREINGHLGDIVQVIHGNFVGNGKNHIDKISLVISCRKKLLQRYLCYLSAVHGDFAGQSYESVQLFVSYSPS